MLMVSGNEQFKRIIWGEEDNLIENVKEFSEICKVAQDFKGKLHDALHK
jgi:hypothetical protein